MSKKKRWFNKPTWVGNEIDGSLFPKTIAQHTQKIREFDENGNEITGDDGYYGDYSSSYNWDWNSKLMNNDSSEKGGGKKGKYELVKTEYKNTYDNYYKTGYWRGYYQQPQLTYKYVQQMANALSAQHNIKVQIGNTWKVDLINKTLTYNPASLIYGTKSELLATLMHEIGKLRYVTHPSLLKNKYITMYKQPAMEVLSNYEDLRTDFLMLKAYESASEIYESVIPAIEKQVKSYADVGKEFRRLVVAVVEQKLQNIISNYCDRVPSHTLNPNDLSFQQDLFLVFGNRDLDKVKAQLFDFRKEIEEAGTIYDYSGELLTLMYDLDDQHTKRYENIKEKINLTIDTIEESKKTADSQALVDYLDSTTFPIIEDLMKDAKNKNDAIAKAFPDMTGGMNKEIMKEVKHYMQRSDKGEGVNVDEEGNTKTRNSGKSDRTTPPEWENGDYKTLKDSVSMEIRQLVSRLTFLRREELTVRFQADQKRGKLNSRKLYKASHGSRRLFKKKLENTDTIRSFAFSVLLDISGSMSGDRIIHCTRALIILAEVFKQMQIPFELTTFDNNFKRIKDFEVEIDKAMEKKIGGLPQHLGGSTNLHYGLESLRIHKQPEKNKIVIVLTDGGVGDAKYFDQEYFEPWAKKGIKAVGFGVECESEMAKLCMGNSKVLDNASQLPVEFSKLLKDLIKRK